jgi:uncharacterized membrane protein
VGVPRPDTEEGLQPMAADTPQTWHERHLDDRTFGQRLADRTSQVLGSWPFIIVQTILVLLWIALNVTAVVRRWDPYPFILLNLMFSIQAAYAAPILMMSQNRQAERDRFQAQADFDTNEKAECEIEDIQLRLAAIEQTLERIERATARV